jgi:hypothetical protein
MMSRARSGGAKIMSEVVDPVKAWGWWRIVQEDRHMIRHIGPSHYFLNGVSLCGRYHLIGTNVQQGSRETACKDCLREYTQRQREGQSLCPTE